MNDYEQDYYQSEKNNEIVLIIKLEYCEQCEQY